MESGQVQTLLALAPASLFSTPDGRAFAGLPLGPFGQHVCAIRDSRFADSLIDAFQREQGQPPSPSAVGLALRSLEATARISGPRTPVFRRVAPHNGAILIDLANSEGEVIEITPTGWHVTGDCSTAFQRTSGNLPLPHPAPEPEDLHQLQSLFQLAGPTDYQNLIDWLTGALQPAGPYPILVLQGPPGSGKSVAARLLRSLIDPAEAPLHGMPAHLHELYSLARQNWLLAFDHAGHTPRRITDALCRLASGTAIPIREKGSRAETCYTHAARPILITATENWQPPEDLQRRVLTVNVEVRHPEPESVIGERFHQLRPGLLAALCHRLREPLEQPQLPAGDDRVPPDRPQTVPPSSECPTPRTCRARSSGDENRQHHIEPRKEQAVHARQSSTDAGVFSREPPIALRATNEAIQGVFSTERSRGSALLAVLWLSAALSAIAFTVASNVRGETERTATVVDSLRCYYLAAGSIDRALLYIQWGGKYYHAPMPVMRFSYPSGETIVEIIPESARLNVNRATPADLQAVAQAAGATPDQAALIAQGIAAWRAAAAPGAPADQFTLPVNPSFPARHASFEEIEELLLIRGITPELFYGRYVRDNQDRLRPVGGLKDCLSVYGGTGGFDVNTASPVLLRALGLSPGAVEGIVARRKASPILSMDELAPFQDGSPGFGRLGLTPSPICTLRATARLRLSNGALTDVERSVSAMVRFLPLDYNPPFHIMRWYDNAFSTE